MQTVTAQHWLPTAPPLATAWGGRLLAVHPVEVQMWQVGQWQSQPQRHRLAPDLPVSHLHLWMMSRCNQAYLLKDFLHAVLDTVGQEMADAVFLRALIREMCAP